MQELRRTPLYDRHVNLGAQMVEFGGWDMPIQYKSGIVHEHLTTRKKAGMFDVSHMGRFIFRGKHALPFLQHVLTNNAAALKIGKSHYTLIPDERGGAIDDAYLYNFVEGEYLLVVNAANRKKDWKHFRTALKNFDQVEQIEMEDHTEILSMISLQGPGSKEMLTQMIDSGKLPEPLRNSLSIVSIHGARVMLGRTGYTGEPVCFELFSASNDVGMLWEMLQEQGAEPIGLGARDTLRLEAGLPLYGHEFGEDPEGQEIPIFAVKLARFGVNFSPLKGEFIGKPALLKQFQAVQNIMQHDYSTIADLSRRIVPIALVGKGIARAGSKVFTGEKHVGYVTSGTMVPYWKNTGEGSAFELLEETARRAIGLALLDSDLLDGDRIDVEIRGKRIQALIVPSHLRSQVPPYSRPIIYEPLD